MAAASPPESPQEMAMGSYTLGHGHQTVELTDYEERGNDFRKPEHRLRRVTLKMAEDIRNGHVGSAFSYGQVWTAPFLTDRNCVRFTNKPNDIFVQLIVPIPPLFPEYSLDEESSEAHFPTLNLDQLADTYSRVQPADARKPEESHEKDFANLRFVSRRQGEIPIYHYWVVPERGDKETPNVNPIDEEMPDEFPEVELTQQQKDARAIDENAADRQHEALRKRFDQLQSSPDRRIHPPRWIIDQTTAQMENQIDPRSPRFEAEFHYYSNALQNIPDNVSIYDWMTKEFSTERIYLLDTSIHAGLQDIQAEQTKLYRELLRSEPFRQLKSNAVLKYTMAYFGLPVQPLTRKDLTEARKGESPKTGLRDANALDKDGDDEAEDEMYGSKIIWYTEKPLEFLDTYHERNLGYPMLRRKLNPHYKPAPSVAQQPVQLKGGEPVLRLRGGGVDDSQSNARKSLVLYGDGVRRKINNDFDSVTDIIKSLVGHLPDEEKTFTFDIIPFEAINEETHEIKSEPEITSLSFTWASFTARQFKAKIWKPKGFGVSYVCRIRDGTSVMEPNASLLNLRGDFTGDVIKLEVPGSVDFSLFETDDFNGAGNATSHKTHVAFVKALEKLVCPADIYDVDFNWEIDGQTGSIRPGQANCLTPQIRKILWELKSKDGAQFFKTINMTRVAFDSSLVRILIPGYPGVHNFPKRKYSAVPDEVLAALVDKVKQESIKSFRAWEDIEQWSTKDPLTGTLSEGLLLPFQKDVDPNDLNLFIYNPVGYLVVKPEFQSFTLRDSGSQTDAPNADKASSSKALKWIPSSPVPPLAEFWDQIDKLYYPLAPDFVRVKRLYDETLSEYLGRNFSEDTWKLDVFDTLDSSDIYIQAIFENAEIDDALALEKNFAAFLEKSLGETTPQQPNVTFGAPEAGTQPKLALRTSAQNQKEKKRQQRSPQVDQRDGIANTVHDPVPAGPSDVNHQFRAWNKHMAAEQAAANLKHKSWTEPLSVCLPGQAPKPQIFGPAKEAMIYGGRAAPILYHHDAFRTPTQIQELEQELYRSRYDILLRKEMCPICDHTFEPGPLHDKERMAHIEEHQEALKAAGTCPICDLNEYQFMTREQRRQHIEAFHVRNVLPTSTNDQSFLASRPPPDPKEVCYCFRCGSYTGQLNDKQKAGHEKKCKVSPFNEGERFEEALQELEALYPQYYALMNELLAKERMAGKYPTPPYEVQCPRCDRKLCDWQDPQDLVMHGYGHATAEPKQEYQRVIKDFEAEEDELLRKSYDEETQITLLKPSKLMDSDSDEIISDIEIKLLKYQDLILILEKDLKAEQAYSADLRDQADRDCEDYERIVAQLEGEFSNAVQELEDERAARSNPTNDSQEIAQLQENISSLQKELEDERVTTAQDAQRILLLRGQIQGLHEELELERAVPDNTIQDNQVVLQLQGQISDIQKDLRTAKSELGNVKNALGATINELHNSEVALKVAEQEHSETRGELEDATTAWKDSRQDKDAVVKELEDAMIAWKDSRRENEAMVKELSKYQDEHSKIRGESSSIGEPQRKTREINDQVAEIQVLEEEIEDLAIRIHNFASEYPMDELDKAREELAIKKARLARLEPPMTTISQLARNCPLCKHVYEDNDNHSRYQHFYDRHIFDLEIPDPTNIPANTEVKTTERKPQESAYADYDISSWQEKLVDKRPPFWIKCNYPSKNPCTQRWNSNEYKEVEELRSVMQKHQQEHIASTNCEKLIDADPDYWTCKICLADRGSWSDDPNDRFDKNKFDQMNWKHMIDMHVDKMHFDMRDRIKARVYLFISQQTYEIKERNNEVWDWGYLKRRYEKYETTERQERGHTFWSVEPNAKLLVDAAKEDEDESVEEDEVEAESEQDSQNESEVQDESGAEVDEDEGAESDAVSEAEVEEEIEEQVEETSQELYPSTTHLPPPEKRRQKWYCAICYQCLQDLNHTDRLNHLKSCHPSQTSEYFMKAMLPVTAKMKAKKTAEQYMTSIVLQPPLTTKSPSERKKFQPQTKPSALDPDPVISGISIKKVTDIPPMTENDMWRDASMVALEEESRKAKKEMKRKRVNTTSTNSGEEDNNEDQDEGYEEGEFERRKYRKMRK